jgi:hypothetical protein
MYNEEAHCALIVERCCEMAWPRSRLLIQASNSTACSVLPVVGMQPKRLVRMHHPGSHGISHADCCLQVLDDSTKAHIRDKVDVAVVACIEKGHPVQVQTATRT